MHDIAHAAADAARVPSFDDVLARGQQRRNRRHGLAAGAAALAVASVIGVTQLFGGGDARAPQPTPSPSPTFTDSSAVADGPTQVPYWEGGALHIGTTTIDTKLKDIRFASGTTVVGQADFDDGSEWHLVDGDRLVPMVESDVPVRVVVSPDGVVVAWVESVADDLRRLVLWDVARRQVIDRVDVSVEVFCCDAGGEVFIHGVDLDHRLIYGTGLEGWVWAPGSDPVAMDVGGVAGVSDPWPGGLMIQGRNSSAYNAPPGIYGTVDERGHFERVGTTPVDQNGLWSPDGNTYLFSDGSGSSSLLVQRGGVVSELTLPDEGGWGLIAWESATAFIAEKRGRALARCDVVQLACVQLEQRPTLHTFWAHNWPG